MSQSVTIQSWDPLIFGDGRPFAQDVGAQLIKTMTLPLPSTLAGALRTTYAVRQRGGNFIPDELLGLSQRGPILIVDGVMHFATPSDLVLMKEGEQGGKDKLVYARSRPQALAPREGVNLSPTLTPCLLDRSDLEPTKQTGPHWLSLPEMTAWLASSTLPQPRTEDPFFIPQESRVHVGIAHGTLASQEGALFETRSVHLGTCHRSASIESKAAKTWELSLATLTEAPLATTFASPTPLTLGGERRVAFARPDDNLDWQCPQAIRESLKGAQRVRMTLATPAAFTHGLCPQWVCPPGSSVRLQLVGVVNRRFQHVSGWDLAKCRPKPLRWLAPAGATYFFNLEDGDPTELADLWLKPISDDEQARRDGFGLALWGIW